MILIRWIRRLGRFITLRGLFRFLGAIAVVLLVWFGGPLLALADWKPLASVAARIIFLLGLTVLVLARYLWKARKRRANNEKVVTEMMAGSERDNVLKEEVDTQRDRLRQALALVKKWRPGRFRSVYELPWYMIIGAPGSGKSTALLHSGLEFPLKDEMGIDSVKGVGGTRYCDWWFTNRAVIIDTAGRYTTQESADKRDARGWNSFLGLLKKYRSRQPINGVILSISVADLLEQTPTERMLHARALKQRVQELKNRLGVIFPVYIVVTKFDLLEGFADTFGMLSEQEREAVFGMTFELQAVRDSNALPQAFDQEFDSLLERLSHFLLHRLQQERTPASRRRIYQFPKQVSLLRAPLWNILKEVFFPSAYEEVPLLRGIYLVSSEQGSQTYDKVSQLVDRQFQLNVPSRPASALPTIRDGFFLRHLFEKIIFSEQGLATADGLKEKRFFWFRRLGFAAMFTLSLGLGAVWYLSYQWNAGLVENYQTDVDDLAAVLDEPSQNWLRLDALLSQATTLPGLRGSPLPEGGPRGLGLYQGDVLTEAAESAYGRLLQYRFGKELKEAFEIEISGNLANLEYLYETLKAYLMLNQRRHLDKERVRAWFEFNLSRQLPGDINADSRKSLLQHLDQYLALGRSMALNPDLVARARAELTAIPLSERAYQRIKRDAEMAQLADFRLPMALGSVAELVFERRSGASVRDGIPGLYTLVGYRSLFQPEKDKIVARLLEDSWIYGEDAEDYRNLDEAEIKVRVEDAYFRDYVYQWQNFLADLRVKPFIGENRGTRIAKLLAGPDAPVSRLMEAVKYHTRLSLPEEESEAADAAADIGKEQLARRQRHASELMRMLPAGASEPEKTRVDRSFEHIHELSGEIFANLQADARVMARYFEEQDGGRPEALATVSRGQFDGAVKSFYSTLSDSGSEELQRILGGFVTDSRRQVKTTVTREINEIWRSTVYSDYQLAIEGKYPFNGESDTDVALMDFANFFGYGGTLDQFFKANLEAHVDKSHSPWRLTSEVGISQSSLRFFERARRIRMAFFEPGSREPSVSFTLKPVYLDQRITQFLLEVDGQPLVYRHGPSRAVGFRWPDSSGPRQTRIAFTPGGKSNESAQRTYPGTWSVFRLLQSSGAMKTDAREQGVDIYLNEYVARLALTTDSVRHPFHTDMLQQFRLPSQL